MSDRRPNGTASDAVERELRRLIARADGMWTGRAATLRSRLAPAVYALIGDGLDGPTADCRLLAVLPNAALRIGVTGLHMTHCPRDGWMVTLTAAVQHSLGGSVAPWPARQHDPAHAQ